MEELLGKCSYGPEMQAGEQVQSHDEMVDREISITKSRSC